MNKKVVIIAAIVVLITAAVLFYFLGHKDAYIGSLGDEKVTEAEYVVFFRAQASLLLSEYDIYSQEEKEEFWDKSIDGRSTRDISKERTVEKLKEFKIQISRAKEHGIKLDKEELANARKYVEDLIKSVSDSTDKKEIEKEFTNKYGVSSKQYESVYKNIMLIWKLIDYETASIEPKDEELVSFYEENKDFLDDFTIRDILFTTIDLESGEILPEEDRIEAANKAVLVLQKIQDGVDVEKLALENSDDPEIKKNKGKYTFKIPRDFQSEIERWTLNSKQGDTGIVQTVHGYHVLKLEKRYGYEDVEEHTKKVFAQEKYLNMLETLKKDPQNDFIIKNQIFIDSIDITTV